MKCKVMGPGAKKVLFTLDVEPECGEDFCDHCGDCLTCHTGGCMVDGEWQDGASHSWVVYHEDIPSFIKEHEELPEQTKTDLMHAYDGV